MQINVVGDFFGSSGYANHTRHLANALAKQVDVRLSTNIPVGWEQQVTDRELLMIKKQPKKGEINLLIVMPHMWKIFTGPGRNWAYCVWEGDKVPKSFVEEFINPDIEYILVPSEHTKKAIMRTLQETNTAAQIYIQEKMKVVPHGVNLDKFYSQESPRGEKLVEGSDASEPSQTTETPNGVAVGNSTTTHPGFFTFVANKGFRTMEDRGGIQYLIQAYLQEFTNEDKVELLIKLNPAYGIGPVNEIIKKYAKPNSPIIKVNADNMPYEKLVDLYNKGEVFVSPTRADAFNIPCLEAMACGLPVITTNFGGQTDYVNDTNGWIIGGELKEVEHEVMYESIQWLTPDITELMNIMRNVFEGVPTIPIKAKNALETAKQMTWDHSASIITSLFKAEDL